MDIKILEQFEQDINSLLESYVCLKQENNQLKEGYTRLLLENQNMHKKQMHLGERIDALLQRLREAISPT